MGSGEREQGHPCRHKGDASQPADPDSVAQDDGRQPDRDQDARLSNRDRRGRGQAEGEQYEG